MNRRAFLSLSVGGVGLAAAVRTWPFRVFSFPTDIKTANTLFVPKYFQYIVTFDKRYNNGGIDYEVEYIDVKELSEAEFHAMPAQNPYDFCTPEAIYRFTNRTCSVVRTENGLWLGPNTET